MRVLRSTRSGKVLTSITGDGQFRKAKYAHLLAPRNCDSIQDMFCIVSPIDWSLVNSSAGDFHVLFYMIESFKNNYARCNGSKIYVGKLRVKLI